MLKRSARHSSTCLTPLSATAWRVNLSLAGFIAMTAAMPEPAEARLVVDAQNSVLADGSGPLWGKAPASCDAAAADNSPLPGDGSIGHRSALFDPASGFLVAQSSVNQGDVLSGTPVCDQGSEGGECVGISFPRPSDDGTPPEDGGLPPQVSSPSLAAPDLLITKPRVVPDLEGRFSNGGNEEIW